jgi:hypothetical protein
MQILPLSSQRLPLDNPAKLTTFYAESSARISPNLLIWLRCRALRLPQRLFDSRPSYDRRRRRPWRPGQSRNNKLQHGLESPHRCIQHQAQAFTMIFVGRDCWLVNVVAVKDIGNNYVMGASAWSPVSSSQNDRRRNSRANSATSS